MVTPVSRRRTAVGIKPDPAQLVLAHRRIEMDFAEAMADQLTHCWASTKGCKKMPVRMIYETAKDNTVDMVMLCSDHAAIYQPEGEVISDTLLGDESTREMLNAARW